MTTETEPAPINWPLLASLAITALVVVRYVNTWGRVNVAGIVLNVLLWYAIGLGVRALWRLMWKWWRKGR